MASGAQISDGELAAINAAAVTREYRVQPHLGASRRVPQTPDSDLSRLDYRTVSAING
jgi:V-type H+-transporting ATPase subunit B